MSVPSMAAFLVESNIELNIKLSVMVDNASIRNTKNTETKLLLT